MQYQHNTTGEGVMKFNIGHISRPEKYGIVKQIGNNLAARAQNGPAEPGLDVFIVECKDLAAALGTHVQGHVSANTERTAKLTLLAKLDAKVDTLYRHIFHYLDVESRAEHSPHAADSRSLLNTAFPDLLERVNDAIADENRYCRKALEVLRSADYASTVHAIELPLTWLDTWEAALSQSEATLLEVSKARIDKHQHIGAGKNAEEEWVELMVRLRKYMASRAKRSETTKIAEGEALLAPLLSTIARYKANAATRATRKEKAKEETSQQKTG